MTVFKKAERKQARLRLGISGPSGAGKTYGALLVAQGLGGRIAVIDTEHESASLYADLCDFDTMALHAPYSPERYIEAITAAEQAGYGVLVIDSYSHEWIGSGGCLEINEEIARAKYKGNTWSAWNETTPRHRRLIEKILTSPLHIICTLRSKTETVQGEGKKVLKLGMKTEQRDGTDYEFTVMLDVVHDGNVAVASKDRTRLFQQPERISVDTGKKLLAWLNNGKSQGDAAKEVVEAALFDMSNADTMQELQTIYTVVMRTAGMTEDQRAALVAKKDERKAALQGE